MYMNKIIQSIYNNQSDIVVVGSGGDRLQLKFEAIENVAVTIWRKAMLKHFENNSNAGNIIARAILDAAKEMRRKEFHVSESDISELKSAVSSYIGYDSYDQLVEKPILNMIPEIYANISTGYNFDQFIKTMETITTNEISWATLVFPQKTVDALKESLQQTLIVKNMPHIEENIDSCLESFNSASKYVDINFATNMF